MIFCSEFSSLPMEREDSRFGQNKSRPARPRAAGRAITIDMALPGVTRVDEITAKYMGKAPAVTLPNEMSAFTHSPGGELRLQNESFKVQAVQVLGRSIPDMSTDC